MQQQERNGAGLIALAMHEVEGFPGELRELVELRFLRPPVEAVLPVLDQQTKEAAVGAMLPYASAVEIPREPRAAQARLQIVEDLLLDVQRVRRGAHRETVSTASRADKRAARWLALRPRGRSGVRR
jgi:hypothetical protein